ncbi:hypothetical protein DFA_02976 [Cavenderia fasciculata]|uniref:Uncharacterized protein n=1 Tax=Cavenderia fasciculata TaxID=261658 RepID=F4PG98_CACFS|nr:uncharacterized protein DFA_02976 [Cavenderia fasciculata]EGG24732.1 hypothetical protein DFA_02976 [Cavenderia fasciculata]|eukprot:XP_004362583.1 hypothetical protein DFA_02976 [Cavenderia fasciculata]
MVCRQVHINNLPASTKCSNLNYVAKQESLQELVNCVNAFMSYHYMSINTRRSKTKGLESY